jgi:SsrA-binding protein
LSVYFPPPFFIAERFSIFCNLLDVFSDEKRSVIDFISEIFEHEFSTVAEKVKSKAAAKPDYTKTIQNRKARFEYEILETLEAGISLQGTEVKSIRLGKATLDDSFGMIRGDEITLENMQITPYELGTIDNHEAKRSRKLLLHKSEILKLKYRVSEKGLTLVPLKLYFTKKGKAKLEIALVRGKQLYDKRETIKKRDAEREARRGD